MDQHSLHQPPSLLPDYSPLTPDYATLIQVRAQLLSHNSDMPAYLLAPEVMDLINACPANPPVARLFMSLLWQTGARLNELLALRTQDLIWHQATVNHVGFLEVKLRTLKQRCGGAKNKPLRGRPAAKNSRAGIRIVAVHDVMLINELKDHLARLKDTFSYPHIKAMVKSDSEIDKHRIFINPTTLKGYSAAQVRNWFYASHQTLIEQGRDPMVRISPHIMRHSYAIHLILNRMDIMTVSQLLGHTSLKSTAQYTKIWRSDRLVALKTIAFTTPTTDQLRQS